MIQNNTSKNNTLDDRGEDAGVSHSLSGARLKGLGCGQFRGHSVERGKSLAPRGDPGRSLGFIPQLTI